MSHKQGNSAAQLHCEEYCDVSKVDISNAARLRATRQKFPGVWTVNGTNIGNSEAAEHCMDRIKGFKNAIQGMRIENFRFFLFWMSVELNEEYTRRTYGKKLIQPQPDPYF